MKHNRAEDKSEADGCDVCASVGSTTRRDLLKAGAGLAAAASGAAPAVAAPAVAQTTINLPRAPNLIVLMTDHSGCRGPQKISDRPQHNDRRQALLHPTSWRKAAPREGRHQDRPCIPPRGHRLRLETYWGRKRPKSPLRRCRNRWGSRLTDNRVAGQRGVPPVLRGPPAQWDRFRPCHL
jgi:hypothetical protein